MAGPTLDRASLVDAFGALGRLAWDEGKTVEIAVYGGSALMLLYNWRLATRDVDAVYEEDRDTVRKLARIVAAERGWPDDWLNDGVKAFRSAWDTTEGARRLFGEYPSADAPGLRVLVAKPEYLFAMKCRAMRVAGVDHAGDVDDVRRLANEIGLTNAADALDLVASFYPNAQLPPKVRFGIEEIFSGPDRDATT